MDTLNDLKQLIRAAKRQQSITDAAIEKAIHRLKLICENKAALLDEFANSVTRSVLKRCGT